MPASGLGIEVAARFGEVKVARIQSNTWADKNLRVGDRIQEVDGVRVENSHPRLILQVLSGRYPKKLVIARKGATHRLTTPPPSPPQSKL